ncbi:MAG: TonB family protein [Lewinella sp.]|nr:TonB family protein [Lewinella sp.]
MRFTLTLLFCGLLAHLSAQREYWALTYRDFLEPGGRVLDAREGYTLEQTEDGYYVVKEYLHPGAVLLRRNTYADESLAVREGPSLRYAPSGELLSEGSYADGQKDGEWRTYQPAGHLRTRCYYDFGELIECEETAPDPGLERPAQLVEEMPRFPGCEELLLANERKRCSQEALLNFVYRNLRYPQEARDNEVEGTVVVTFVVEVDGTITAPRIARPIDPDCDAEVLRVVDLFPLWIPGRQGGEPVRVQYNLPVKFKLQ